METVIIAAPLAYDLEIKKRLGEVGVVTTTEDGTLVFEDGKSRVYISRNDAVRDEFEPERLGLIVNTIAQPVFYSVDFSDITTCRKVLAAIVDNPSIMVDNDHGVALKGSEFVKLLRSNHEWDWRYPSQ